MVLCTRPYVLAFLVTKFQKFVLKNHRFFGLHSNKVANNIDGCFYLFIYLFIYFVARFALIILWMVVTSAILLQNWREKKKSDAKRNFEMEISIYVFICIITMSKDCNLGVGNENNLKSGKRISRILGQNWISYMNFDNNDEIDLQKWNQLQGWD